MLTEGVGAGAAAGAEGVMPIRLGRARILNRTTKFNESSWTRPINQHYFRLDNSSADAILKPEPGSSWK